jgi:hypothetical protein
VQALSAVHQEVARFAAEHAGDAPAVLDDAAKRRAARIAVAEVQQQHAVWVACQCARIVRTSSSGVVPVITSPPLLIADQVPSSALNPW